MKSAAIIVILFLMSSCTPVHLPKEAKVPQVSPRLEVFIVPEAAPAPPLGSALLSRLEVPYHELREKEGLKRIVKGALFQTRLFTSLIDLQDAVDYSDYVEAGPYEYARDHHIQYIVEVRIEKLVSPVGVSPGFCALTLEIKRAEDQVTLYSAYGEAELRPAREADYIFFKTPYKKAPTTLQGIMGIIRAMALELTSA